MATEAIPIGEHALIDIVGTQRLDDPAFLEQVMREAARAASAHRRGEYPLLRRRPGGKRRAPARRIAYFRSHLARHRFAAIDVFMCGSAVTGEAIAAIAQAFQKQP